MPVLDYCVNDVSFKCHINQRKSLEYRRRVYFKDQYFFFQLNEAEYPEDAFKEDIQEAPYYWLDNNTRCIIGRTVYAGGLFHYDYIKSRGVAIDFLQNAKSAVKYKHMIGFAELSTHKEDDSILVLSGGYIHPQHRGQGLSRLLYQGRIDWALQQPRYALLLTRPNAKNTPSIEACKAFGFEFNKELTPEVTRGDELVAYSLDLDHYRKNRSLHYGM